MYLLKTTPPQSATPPPVADKLPTVVMIKAKFNLKIKVKNRVGNVKGLGEGISQPFWGSCTALPPSGPVHPAKYRRVGALPAFDSPPPSNLNPEWVVSFSLLFITENIKLPLLFITK